LQSSLINARAEGIEQKPSFRRRFKLAEAMGLRVDQLTD
jgi:putative SOS response-associated peptidase YedK